MDKEQIQAIVEKVVSTMQDKTTPAETASTQEPAPAATSNDKVVIDLQKSYEKVSGQLDEINRKLTEKEQAPTNSEKKPLVI